MQDSWHLPDPETQPEFYQDVPMKRLLAWLIDTVLIAVGCILILPFTAFAGIFFFPALMLMVGFVYRTITLANSSATLGMRVMAIEFRTAQGARFDLPIAALHTFSFTMSWVFILVQLTTIVLIATSARAQGLTDLALGTVVLNRRAAN